MLSPPESRRSSGPRCDSMAPAKPTGSSSRRPWKSLKYSRSVVAVALAASGVGSTAWAGTTNEEVTTTPATTAADSDEAWEGFRADMQDPCEAEDVPRCWSGRST